VRRMFATYIQRAEVNADLTKPAMVSAGDLVMVEVPHNCAIYAVDPVSARDVALSWFEAGVHAVSRTAEGWEAEFDLLWQKHGIARWEDA
jgi:hypothetical protein